MKKIVRDFKRHYHKTRKLIPDLAEGSFTFSLNWREEKLSAGTSTPNIEKSIQFAVLMRRFLARKSDLYYEKVLDLLAKNAPYVFTEEKQQEFKSYIDSVNRGPIAIQINGKHLTAEEIYSLISDGEFFREDEQISRYLKELSSTPVVGPLFWHQFYSYTLESFYLISALFDLFLEWQKAESTSENEEIANTHISKCIYCLSSDNTFGSEEHIFPEGLGNDEAILPKGYVCDTCNNGILSELDSYLIEFEPIAFSIVQYVPYTKSGKLPKANFQNMIVEKTHPRRIKITAKDKSGQMSIKQDLGDGWAAWNLNLRGKVMDPMRLGRSLYKIALGFVALDQGVNVTLSTRFDLARNYIMGRSGFPNNLWISKVIHPHPSFSVAYKDMQPGCHFAIDIFGMIFVFNLEAQPLIEPNDELINKLSQKYWLEKHSGTN